MIANLHSILTSPWYIEQSYADSLLPLLHNIMTGQMRAGDDEDKPEPKVTFVNYDVFTDSLRTIGTGTQTSEEAIAIIELHQPIMKYSQECGPTGTQEIMQMMEDWRHNDNVKAVLLDIDSGGGQSSGTPEFAHFIKNYGKPVGVYTNGSMASAAYYIGCAGDFIIMNEHADFTGSIGAYLEFLDITGYLEKLGAKQHTIYATKSTEKNLAYREALKENYEPIRKKVLDPLVDKFHADMRSFRPQLSEKVFKGDIYSPEESMELGLVDAFGDKKSAVLKLIEMIENF